jgi:hypothetical protein
MIINGSIMTIPFTPVISIPTQVVKKFYVGDKFDKMTGPLMNKAVEMKGNG